MSLPNLEDILAQCGVDPLRSSDLQSGWNSENFACVVSDVDEVDNVLPDLFPTASDHVTLLQKAALKAAWKRCHAGAQPSGPSPPLGENVASSDQTSWSETFAPKLDSSKIAELKSQFLRHYPSEILNHETMPSTRLLSLVQRQLQKGWRWVPWKFRLTAARSEEVSSQRSAKLPRLETTSLHALLLDEPPSIDISNTGMGANAIRNLLAVHDIAIAMCGGVHLANLKSYRHKFISLLTQRVDSDSGLRCPSVTEAQSADRQLWMTMGDLMSENHWKMDD